MRSDRTKNRTGARRKPTRGDARAEELRRLQEEDVAHEEFATKPGAFTLWLRRSILWQLIRFVVINLRMLSMISKAQPRRL